MRLQVNNEFQQVKIKDLNDKHKVTMFMTSIRGGKTFAAEQKKRKLKSRIAKLKGISDKIKAKISPATIIKQSAENMNNVKSKKYGISPNGNEKNGYLANGLKHFSSLKEQNDQKKKSSDRLDRYDQKNKPSRKKNCVKF